jgi:hypothetical protein
MVGPSHTEDERRVASRRLKFAFVGLVGVSGGFVSLVAGATTGQALAAVGGGLLVGGALTRYLSSVGREWQAPGRR